MANIHYDKKDILSCVQKLHPNNNSNNNDINMESNDTINYFTNSFYEKISNLIHKDSVPEDVFFPEKNQKPNKIESITHLSYYKELYNDINIKKEFKDFNKSIFENDKQNEVLYTFIYCLLNSRNSSLKTIHDLIDIYSSAIKEIIGGMNNNSGENNSDIKSDIYEVVTQRSNIKDAIIKTKFMLHSIFKPRKYFILRYFLSQIFIFIFTIFCFI